MCNIPIYFCNINIKHLQRTSETSETLEIYAYNMCFQRNVTCLDEWRLVVTEFNADTEVSCGAWSLSCDSGAGNSTAVWQHHMKLLPLLACWSIQ
jgi:hypothetical protein